jgi:hypothetical protein
VLSEKEEKSVQKGGHESEDLSEISKCQADQIERERHISLTILVTVEARSGKTLNSRNAYVCILSLFE